MANHQTFIDIRRDLHLIPEAGYQEFKTQAYLLDYIRSLGAADLSVKLWKTGIIVRIPGLNPGKTIGYRADIDGLPIPEETGLAFKSTHEGMMHACGHDFHMAIGLGVLTHFVRNRMNDNLVFIFQPAEEGPGGALPLLESGELAEYKLDYIFALHIAPDYKVGQIAIKEGKLFANTSELFIDIMGKSGHAAFPHLSHDTLVAMSHFMLQLQSIISRNVNPIKPAVLTIGKIDGGFKQNVIADRVRLEGTIRTLDAETMTLIKGRIESLLQGLEVSFNCTSAIDYGANYMQVYNHPEVTRAFMDWAKDLPGIQLIECEASMTGEDFGYLLERIPGFMFWLGVDSEHGLHHAKLNPDEGAIPVAIDTLVQYLSWLGR
ncbi:N-acetyldiaminopimelate deacetylase [Paenibacillus methanolicus]|uniref:N-acetyldiaminopimelate deacetylase n=1 Tax=Paenibacillus methanolicus TaxID=582686 RepID=A0A5S5BPP0_9BACL|nr:N-acetyldiaminopimelate deacetylase [Paenibacillus methanolicus]TYP68102.1 N-acetyldiaminopimelate deacetylase [Paenibacillus methanolicus]